MSFNTHVICTCQHPPSTGFCCICIWFFQQLHSKNWTKQTIFISLPCFREKTLFLLFSYPNSFRFLFWNHTVDRQPSQRWIQGRDPATPLFLDQTETRRAEKNVFETVSLISGSGPPRPPLPPVTWRSESALLLILLKDSYQKKTLSSDTTLWNCPWGCFWEFLVGCVPPSSPNLDSISDKKMSFFKPVFRPSL